MSALVPTLETIFTNPVIFAIIFGAVGSVMGAVIVLTSQYIYREYIGTRNDYSGFWEASTSDKNGKVIKKDLMQIKCNKKTEFTASIYRITPEQTFGQEWNCSGIIIDGAMLAIFYSEITTAHSFGVGYQTGSDTAHKYTGYYLRPRGKTCSKIGVSTEKIHDIDDWRKKNLTKIQIEKLDKLLKGRNRLFKKTFAFNKQ
jgi:hypothetical protein